MKNQRFRKNIFSLLLAAWILGLTGCYGSFTLTKKLYTWNGNLGEPAVNTLVMWPLIIFQV